MGNLLRQNNEAIESQFEESSPQIEDYSRRQQADEGITHIYIKIKSEATKDDINQIATVRNYVRLMSTQTWFIDFRHEVTDYPYFFSLIQECQGVLTLQLLLSSVSLFPLQVMDPMYPNLRKLTLSNCSLTTIEFLSLMDAPNLKELNLSNNLLTSIKPVRKLKERLQILNVRLNFLTNVWDNSIQMIDFGEEVEGLNFEEMPKVYYGDDINWLFKLNCKSIIRLELNGKTRIPTKMSTLRMVTQKFRGPNGLFCWGPVSKMDMHRF